MTVWFLNIQINKCTLATAHLLFFSLHFYDRKHFPPRLRSSREKLADRKTTIRFTRFFQTETRQHKRRLGTWNLFILKQRALSAIFRWIHYQFLFFAFFYAPVLIPLLLTYYVLYLSEDTKASDVFFCLHIHVIPSLQNEQRARVYRPFVFGRR